MSKVSKESKVKLDLKATLADWVNKFNATKLISVQKERRA